MVTYVIELSDADIKVATAGEIVLHSPGYALVKDTQIEVGEAAYNQARLHPRRAHNQFWHRLSLDPLTHPTPYYRHHADLVHAHLKHIAEQLEDSAEAVFAVPGSYSKEQLSLLLGVVQESPLTAVGLVDMAAAVASVYPLHQTAFYLDIFLHEAVVSRLDVGDQINRSKVIPVKGVGLAKLYDRWVQLVADVFIEQCRFDPLHSAVTEQALYRKLPLWLAAIEQEQDARRGPAVAGPGHDVEGIELGLGRLDLAEHAKRQQGEAQQLQQGALVLGWRLHVTTPRSRGSSRRRRRP